MLSNRLFTNGLRQKGAGKIRPVNNAISRCAHSKNLARGLFSSILRRAQSLNLSAYTIRSQPIRGICQWALFLIWRKEHNFPTLERHTFPDKRMVFSDSISAEHGLGLMKADCIGYTKGDAAISVMRGVKNLLDPNGILNPYKVLPVDV